jgi:uncharacterized protein YutE (UPF0331/DUF86 family)
VTDREVVLRKLTSIREHVARIRRRRAVELAVFKADVDRQDALSMSLLVAVQDALDVALHMAADEGWGVPASYAESFSLLAAHGVIDAPLSTDLARMATLRNRLAHGYATVDVERIWQEIPAGVDALDAFTGAIAAWLSRQALDRVGLGLAVAAQVYHQGARCAQLLVCREDGLGLHGVAVHAQPLVAISEATRPVDGVWSDARSQDAAVREREPAAMEAIFVEVDVARHGAVARRNDAHATRALALPRL